MVRSARKTSLLCVAAELTDLNCAEVWRAFEEAKVVGSIESVLTGPENDLYDRVLLTAKIGSRTEAPKKDDLFRAFAHIVILMQHRLAHADWRKTLKLARERSQNWLIR